MPPDADARYATEEALRHIMLDYRQMAEFVKEPFVVARADGIRFYLRRARQGEVSGAQRGGWDPSEPRTCPQLGGTAPIGNQQLRDTLLP